MPNTLDSSKLKQILIERRSYPLMLVGGLLFLGCAFFVGPLLPALIGWVVFVVGIIEYFRGFR